MSRYRVFEHIAGEFYDKMNNCFIDEFKKRFKYNITFLGHISRFHCFDLTGLYEVNIDNELYILHPTINNTENIQNYCKDFEKYIKNNNNNLKFIREYDTTNDKRYEYFLDVEEHIRRWYKDIKIEFKSIATYKNNTDIYDVEYKNKKIRLERKVNDYSKESMIAWLDIMIEDLIEKNENTEKIININYSADTEKNQLTIFDMEG